MSFTKFEHFEEVLLYGNIQVIGDVEISQIIHYLKDIKINVRDKTQWCLFNNIKYLLGICDIYITTNNKLFAEFTNFVKRVITELKNIFKIDTLTIDDENYIGIIIHLIINMFNNKVKALNSSLNINLGHKDFIKDNIIYIEYNIPYGIWTSKYIFIVNDQKIQEHSIDIYIDNLFLNDNFKYSSNCLNFIQLLKKRLDIVSELTFYKKFIFDKLNDVSKKIFNTYPLNLIYTQYRILNFEGIYYPNMFEKINIDNDEAWTFSIIDDTLRCYLLGVSTISNGCISEKLQVEKIKKFIMNKTEYYTKIYNNNKIYIDIVTDDLECANGVDEDGPYDLLFNHIYKYNKDDILILFSHSSYHLFTCSEYEELSKKKLNPYNRQKINQYINKIKTNLDWKNKLVYKLNKRYINIDLNNSLEDNFNNLLKKLDSEKVINNTKLLNQKRLNLLMTVI